MKTKLLTANSFEEALKNLQDLNIHLEDFNILFDSNPTGTMFKGRNFHPDEFSWFELKGSKTIIDEEKSRIAIAFEFIFYRGMRDIRNYYFLVKVTRDENQYTINYVLGQCYKINIFEFEGNRLVYFTADSNTIYNNKMYERVCVY